jgi:hypothetical protein
MHFACFWAYIGQPHDHIGWATSMSFASINPTNPRTNPWNFHKFFLRIGDLKKKIWAGHFEIFFSKKKNFFLLHSHGLRIPNEGINQRYLKNWADVVDKICFGLGYLKIWDWDWIFGRAVTIFSLGVRSPCSFHITWLGQKNSKPDFLIEWSSNKIKNILSIQKLPIHP